MGFLPPPRLGGLSGIKQFRSSGIRRLPDSLQFFHGRAEILWGDRGSIDKSLEDLFVIAQI